MKIYLKHVKPYLAYFLLAPVFMLLEVYCDVKIPSLSAQIINLSSENAEVSAIIFSSIEMLLFALFAVLCGIGSTYSATKASVNFCHDLRDEVFVKIQSFSFNNIDKFSTGSLITRLTNDITQIGQIVVMSLRMVFRAPGMLIGAIIMAYSISPKISIIFLVLTPVLALIVIVVIYISYPRFAKLQDKIDALNTSIQEGLVNVRVIKAFTRENFEKKKFKNVNDDLKDTGVSAYKVSITQMPIMTLVVNFSTVAILWFGSKLLGNGELEIGNISALITYLAQILMSVNMIAKVFLQSSRSMVSQRRVLAVLEEKIDISDENASDKKVMSGDIEFKNVNFKYYQNSLDNVLSGINLHIKSGECVGIVGSTGCGKTTLVHLISRLYDVNSGEINVDGDNIKNYSLKNLREGVAVVLQNNILFSGTVKENIRWGNKNASEDEIDEVAKFSASDEFINNMTDGYDTNLHQGGLNLSGGQKQRLCIARALAKNTKILILDDSTSAVDTATERKITNHLTNNLKDVTKIIIAQRISSVINCDFIVVMDNGTIADIGTHEDLLENSKIYKEICNSQMHSEQGAKR
ncbi:MAG: ABC transporter ATP-binding protein [Clostridia bacterium]